MTESTGQQRAAAHLAAHIATQRDPDDYEPTASRAVRRRAALGLHRALTLELGRLRPDALVEVAAWLSKPDNVVWMAQHVVDVAELNIEEEKNKQ